MNSLEFRAACLCAGTGCGGHLMLATDMTNMTVTPIGYQGPAQHTYTPACAGHHEPGPCPPSQQPVTVRFGP